jgi:ankyrin repeat protein
VAAVTSSDEIFAAIEADDVDRVRAVLVEDPSAAAARDAEGVSALLRARYRRDRALVEAIRAHADPSDVFEAATFGDLDLLTRLLDAAASVVDERSGDGFTALHLAAFFGQADAVRLLVARGASVDARGTGWMVGTPLHSAASGSHVEAAGVLLDAGADADARQADGWTPLHAAAANGDAALVRRLLEAGADAEAVNDAGTSARELAAASGDAETVAVLG